MTKNRCYSPNLHTKLVLIGIIITLITIVPLLIVSISLNNWFRSQAEAETIVELGINWDDVKTVRDLQSGLLMAIDELHT